MASSSDNGEINAVSKLYMAFALVYGYIGVGGGGVEESGIAHFNSLIASVLPYNLKTTRI